MWRPYLSVCDLVPATKPFCEIFVKFGTGVIYEQLPS